MEQHYLDGVLDSLDEALDTYDDDGVDRDKLRLRIERAKAIGMVSLAKSAEKFIDFLGYNAHTPGFLDQYVAKLAEALSERT